MANQILQYHTELTQRNNKNPFSYQNELVQKVEKQQKAYFNQ